ncbi:universal stress protein [Oceanobacillus sojae]|uniref:universal stress protein n=1 Tax=Oceanobacillus sojae TaxID=582851 RepID=UPI0021A57015|nr:universal stress protein [Oceanobacillus sojae]MCT1902791.1 universal stress protein [Oceanobacillus sojae]
MSFNILVAYDGSDLSRKAVEEAKKQVKLAEDAVLHVVTVISNGGPTVNVALARSFMNDLAEEARPAIESIREELEGAGIACKADILMDYTFRNPASQLIDYAKENEIELIVLGSRGLGGVGRFFLGSVSSQIVHQAQCKVLVVK